jgi:hypothetical protein
MAAARAVQVARALEDVIDDLGADVRITRSHACVLEPIGIDVDAAA